MSKETGLMPCHVAPTNSDPSRIYLRVHWSCCASGQPPAFRYVKIHDVQLQAQAASDMSETGVNDEGACRGTRGTVFYAHRNFHHLHGRAV